MTSSASSFGCLQFVGELRVARRVRCAGRVAFDGRVVTCDSLKRRKIVRVTTEAIENPPSLIRREGRGRDESKTFK